MEPRVNYALVGLFIVVMSAGVIFGGLWLGAGLDVRDYRRYDIFVTDTVSGLGRDSPVTFYGVDVGRVAELEVDREQPGRVRVTVEVERDAPVRADTVASLKMRGLTGIAFIDLTGGRASDPELTAGAGERYPVIAYRESLLMRLDTAVTDGMDVIESFGARINQLLSRENTEAIGRTLASTVLLTERLAETSTRLDTTLDRFDALLVSGHTLGDEASMTLTRTRDSLDEIDRMSASIERAGHALTGLGEQGEASLSEWRSGTLPRMEALIAELRRTAARAGELANSLREEPGRVLEQRERPRPGPGE